MWGLFVRIEKKDENSSAAKARNNSYLKPNFMFQGLTTKTIQNVMVEARRLHDKINRMSDSAKGLTIIQSFVLDMLGAHKNKGNIFATKSGTDYQTIKSVSFRLKAFATVCVVVLNIAFVFFLMIAAQHNGEEWRKAWLMAGVTTIFIIVVVEMTVECLVLSYAIPSSIGNEIRSIQFQLRLCAQRVCGIVADTNVEGFNACKYLFVSNYLAHQFSHLPEAQLVLAYRETIPRNLNFMAHSLQSDPSSSQPFRHGANVDHSRLGMATVHAVKPRRNSINSIAELEDQIIGISKRHGDAQSSGMCGKVASFLRSLVSMSTSALPLLILLGGLPVPIQRVLVLFPLPFISAFLGAVFYIFESEIFIIASFGFCFTLFLLWLVICFRGIYSAHVDHDDEQLMEKFKAMNEECQRGVKFHYASNGDDEDVFASSSDEDLVAHDALAHSYDNAIDTSLTHSGMSSSFVSKKIDNMKYVADLARERRRISMNMKRHESRIVLTERLKRRKVLRTLGNDFDASHHMDQLETGLVHDDDFNDVNGNGHTSNDDGSDSLAGMGDTRRSILRQRHDVISRMVPMYHGNQELTLKGTSEKTRAHARLKERLNKRNELRFHNVVASSSDDDVSESNDDQLRTFFGYDVTNVTRKSTEGEEEDEGEGEREEETIRLKDDLHEERSPEPTSISKLEPLNPCQPRQKVVKSRFYASSSDSSQEEFQSTVAFSTPLSSSHIEQLYASSGSSGDDEITVVAKLRRKSIGKKDRTFRVPIPTLPPSATIN